MKMDLPVTFHHFIIMNKTMEIKKALPQCKEIQLLLKQTKRGEPIN